MTRKIDARLVSALLVGLLAFFTSGSAFAGANHKKAAVVAHARYYLYEPPPLSFPSVSRALSDGHEVCYLPSDGCDNNHSIAN